MTAALLVLTNAALTAVWACGIGAVSVGYELDPAAVSKTNRESVAFRDDPKTEAKVVRWYSGSGFDRGHLAPAADFATAGRRDLEATYLSSNLAPMTPAFNRGEWAQVEKECRETAKRLGVKVTVTTIPVYGGTNRLGAVAVPTAFVKLLATNGVTVAAWLKEQEVK